MEEFIENFNEFREWLHNYETEINVTTEGAGVYYDIAAKFEELGLNDAF